MNNTAYHNSKETNEILMEYYDNDKRFPPMSKFIHEHDYYTLTGDDYDSIASQLVAMRWKWA